MEHFEEPYESSAELSALRTPASGHSHVFAKGFCTLRADSVSRYDNVRNKYLNAPHFHSQRRIHPRFWAQENGITSNPELHKLQSASLKRRRRNHELLLEKFQMFHNKFHKILYLLQITTWIYATSTEVSASCFIQFFFMRTSRRKYNVDITI